jgi:hypothetical protein
MNPTCGTSLSLHFPTNLTFHVFTSLLFLLDLSLPPSTCLTVGTQTAYQTTNKCTPTTALLSLFRSPVTSLSSIIAPSLSLSHLLGPLYLFSRLLVRTHTHARTDSLQIDSDVLHLCLMFDCQYVSMYRFTPNMSAYVSFSCESFFWFLFPPFFYVYECLLSP